MPKKPKKQLLFLSSVQAGFPSHVSDEVERHLDLNSLLVQHPEASFFVRVEGDSMKNAGIFPGDILCVDRSLDPKEGDIVIAVIDGEATVKRFLSMKGKKILSPDNDEYSSIEISEESDVVIWGVVTGCVKKFC